MNVFDLQARLGLNSREFEAGLSRAQRLGARLGGGLRTLGRTAGIATGAAAAGLSTLAAAGTAAAASLEANMANVNTLLGGNAERTRELTEEVKRLGPETGQSLSDLSGGLYQVVSAFGDGADTARSLEINAKAAAAGLATTEQAIALTSAVTKGYGDTSAAAQQQAADLAFTAVRLGQTTFPELAGSIGRVVPLTSELGVSQEELFAVMATGTGVTGNAAEVSTQLRGVMQGLMAPTADMTDLFADLGVESGEALIEQRGLQGAIETVIAAAEESGTPLQKYLGSIEGQTLALALAGSQSDVYAEKLAEMGDASGAASEAFEIQQATVTGLWKQIKSATQVILVNIGERALPMLRDFLDWVVENLPAIIAAVDTALDRLGEIFGWIQDAVSGVMATLAPILSGMRGMFRQTGDDLAESIGPAREAWDAFAEFVVALWETRIRPTLNVLVPFVAGIFEGVKGAIEPVIEAVTAILRGLTDLLRGDVIGAFDEALNAIAAIWEGASELLGGILSGVGDAMIEAISGLPGEFGELGGEIMAGLREGITGALDSVRGAIGDVGESVAGRFRSILGIQSPSTVFAEHGREILRGLRNGLQDGGLLGEILGVVGEIAGGIADAFETIALRREIEDRLAARNALSADDASRNAASAATSARFAAGRRVAGRRARGDGGLGDLTANQAVGAMAEALTRRAGRGDGGLGQLRETQEIAAAAGARLALEADDAARNANAAASGGIFAQARADQRAAQDAAIFGALGAGGGEGYRSGNMQRDAAIFGALGAAGGSEGYGAGGAGFEGTGGPSQLMQALGAAGDALGTFGESILATAREKVPALDAAITGFAQGGPLGALTSVFSSLIGESEAFQGIMTALNKVTGPLVKALTTVLDALWPIIDVALALVKGALQPLTAILENVVAPVFEFVARIIATIWNAIARAINAVLGWLGVNLRTIDLDGDAPREEPAPKEPLDPEEARGGSGEVREATFSNVSQGIQLAVATPFVEASTLMHEAAGRISQAFAPEGGGAFAEFVGVLDRLTPVLERFLREGVDLNIPTASPGRPADRTGALRGV